MSTNQPTLQNPDTLAVRDEALAGSTLVRLAQAALHQAPGAEPPWAELDLDDPAARRFGDYELLEVLGAGGMGVVYRARQLSLEREVALKFIAAGAQGALSVERFLAEARAAARLNHPNIVPVYEVGSVSGLHYFSMQLVEGTHLGKRLERGVLTEREAIDLLLPLCGALDYAHRLGLLHLDLKPANILIDERGAPLIADFGLARRTDASGSVETQEVSGTPSYMAPEQILIKQFRLTAATDVYALGAVLFEMLAGISPHGRGQPDDVIRRAVAGRLESLVSWRPRASRDIVAVCMHCLDLDPKRRYPSISALAEDLRHVRDGLPVSVRVPSRFERAQRWIAREPRFAGALAAALIAVAGGAIASWTLWQRADRERDAAIAAQASEQTQRVRAQDATALGAHLYARSEDEDGRFDAAQEVVQWLRARVPDDAPRQTAILGDFSQALVDGGSRLQVQSLLFKVVSVLGAEYRRAVSAALERDGSPTALLHAAMLAWHDERDSDDAARYPALLERALAAAPDSVFAWYVATTYCHGKDPNKTCPSEAPMRLTETDPENAFAWAMRASMGSGDDARTALHEAAQREHLRDYFGASYGAYMTAIEKSGVPVPELLAGPARVLAPQEPLARTVAQLVAWDLPVPMWNGLIVMCDPARSPLDEVARADCLALGTRLARSKGGIITNMIGAVIVRRLARGTPLEQEMKDLRLRYTYLAEQTDKLTPAKRLGYPITKMQADIETVGELEAFARLVKSAGIPDQPPAGWVPKDPETLLLPEERGKR